MTKKKLLTSTDSTRLKNKTFNLNIWFLSLVQRKINKSILKTALVFKIMEDMSKAENI